MRRAGAAAIAVLAALAFAAPASAGGAGCGGVRTAVPQRSALPGRAPLVVGDSVLLGAVRAAAARGFSVNARGCRGMEEALSLLSGLRARGRLPRLVVVALGANFSLRADEFARLFRILGPDRYAGLVTQRELGGGSGGDAQVVRRAAATHPRRAMLLDWVRYSAGHGGWFSGDGLHLSASGAEAFARLLARAPRALHAEGRKVRTRR